MKKIQISVIKEDVNKNKKYSDSLKKFLCLTFKNAPSNTQKKLSKKLKTYAQVLGIKPLQGDENEKEKLKQKKKKKIEQKDNQCVREKELYKIICRLKSQIEILTQLITIIYKNSVNNESFKKEVERQLKLIDNKTDTNDEKEEKADTKKENGNKSNNEKNGN